MKTSTVLASFLIASFLVVGFAVNAEYRPASDEKITYQKKAKTTSKDSGFLANAPVGSYFIPTACAAYNFNEDCSYYGGHPGCACYADGTCSFFNDGVTNACTQCLQQGAVSYNDGVYCPNLQGHFLQVCTNTGPVNCNGDNYSGSVCACDNNGNCNEIQETPCQACNNAIILSALEGPCSLLEEQD